MTATATALATAAAVRSGERSAREVTEEALAAVAAGDGALHSFLTVLGDEARAQADAVDAEVVAGRDPGPLAGVPVALEGQPVHPGGGDDVRLEDPGGLAAPLRRHRGGGAA